MKKKIVIALRFMRSYPLAAAIFVLVLAGIVGGSTLLVHKAVKLEVSKLKPASISQKQAEPAAPQAAESDVHKLDPRAANNVTGGGSSSQNPKSAQNGSAAQGQVMQPLPVKPFPTSSPSSGTYGPSTANLQPAPVFTLELSTPESGGYNPYGFKIDIVPDAASYTYSYSKPVVIDTPNGLPCNTRDNGIFNPTNNRLSWEWSCVPFMAGDTIETYHYLYGDYPITFSVTGTNGYGVKVTQTVTGVIHFHESE
jgi:hypothetical protein